MDDITTALRDAFEDAGYDVSQTSVNRDTIRIAVLDPEASGGELRDITNEVVGEDDILSLNVTTESAEHQEPTSVVSFRYRG